MVRLFRNRQVVGIMGSNPSDFLNERCETYRGGMSSPLTGELVCSRLSAHFSVGTVSLREAWQQTLERRDELKEETGRSRGHGA